MRGITALALYVVGCAIAGWWAAELPEPWNLRAAFFFLGVFTFTGGDMIGYVRGVRRGWAIRSRT